MTRFKRSLIILILLVLSLPIWIFFTNEGTTDMSVWLDWSSHIDRWGPLNAYSIINTNHDYERSDYPPISFINLWFALKVASAADVSWIIGIKVIILAYYLATWAALIYLAIFVRKRSFVMGVSVASGLFLGGLYFVVNSVALSYLDITYALFVVLCFALFARGKYLLTGVCLALAILIKWMPMVLLPAFLFYFVNKRGRQYEIDRLPIYKFFVGLILTVSILIVVFLINHLSLFSFVESLNKAFSRGPTLSHALNFNWVVHYILQLIYPENYVVFIRNNSHIFQSISAVTFLIVIITILWKFIKRKKNIISLLETSLMISWSYYIWRTGVHENHLFITVLTALCLAILNTNRSNIQLYLWLCFFGLTSVVVFFGVPVRGGLIPLPNIWMVTWGNNLTVLLAALHVLIYLAYLRKFLQYRHN